jgi:hypothetical protein
MTANNLQRAGWYNKDNKWECQFCGASSKGTKYGLAQMLSHLKIAHKVIAERNCYGIYVKEARPCYLAENVTG